MPCQWFCTLFCSLGLKKNIYIYIYTAKKKKIYIYIDLLFMFFVSLTLHLADTVLVTLYFAVPVLSVLLLISSNTKYEVQTTAQNYYTVKM